MSNQLEERRAKSAEEDKLERFGDNFAEDSSKSKKKKKKKRRERSKKKKKKSRKKKSEKSRDSSRGGKTNRSEKKRNEKTRGSRSAESRMSRSRSDQRFSGERELRSKSPQKRNFQSKRAPKDDDPKADAGSSDPRAPENGVRKSEPDLAKRKSEPANSQERQLKRRKVSPPKTEKADREPKRTVSLQSSPSPKLQNSSKVLISPSPPKALKKQYPADPPGIELQKDSKEKNNAPQPLDKKASPLKMVLKPRLAPSRNPLNSGSRWKEKSSTPKGVPAEVAEKSSSKAPESVEIIAEKVVKDSSNRASNPAKDARNMKDSYPPTASSRPAPVRNNERSRRSRRDEGRSRRAKRKRRSYSRSESPRRRRRKRSPSSSESSSRSPSRNRDRRRRRSRSRTRGRRRRDRRSSYSKDRSRRRDKKRKKRKQVPDWLTLAVEAFAMECSGSKRLSRQVKDFNRDYCRTLMQNIPFINNEMSSVAILQLMGRLKNPYTQYYNCKFNPQSLALSMLINNNNAAKNPVSPMYSQNLGLVGLKRPEEKLREENEKKKEKEKQSESTVAKPSSRSESSESESSESEETAEKGGKSPKGEKKNEKKAAPALKPPMSPNMLPPPIKAKDSSKIDEELFLLTEKKKQMEEQERVKLESSKASENAAMDVDPPEKDASIAEQKKESTPVKTSTPPPEDDDEEEESSSDDVEPSPKDPVISRIDEMLSKKRREQCQTIMAKQKRTKDMDTSQDKLMKMNKLMLFLDVDHTLLHATKSPRAKDHMNNPILKQSIHEIEFPNPNNCPYYVKLRPGVESFLQAAAEKYNIVLYTMGYKAYAEKVRQLMDPTGHYIRAIISREEHVNRRGEGGKKSIQEFIPLYDSNTIIIDDVTKVWEKPDNVLEVPRYSFWPENENLEKDEAWEGNVLEKKEQDFTLRNISYLLNDIHKMWYTPPKPIFSAPRLLDALAKGVLSGCELVFTGIIPQQTNPLDNSVWKLALKFGAKCSQTITETTTHVIADRRITAKVQNGKKKPNLNVVHVNWLYQSAAQFVRADENHFEFRKPPPPRKAHCDKKLEISSLHQICEIDTLIGMCIADLS